MKTRLMLAILILVTCGVIAGCDSSVESNQNKPENKTNAPTEAKTVPPKLVADLKKAGQLIEQAKNDLGDLGKDEEEAQAKAKRVLGYPVFVADDFLDAKGLVAKLRLHTGDLSAYLFTNFKPTTKEMIGTAGDKEPKPELLNTLRDELNQHLKNKKLYTPDLFPKAKLSNETIDELAASTDAGGLSPERLAHLNRALLKDSYKEFIKPLPEPTVLSCLNDALTSADGLKPASASTDVKSKISDGKRDITQLLEGRPGIGPERAPRPPDLDAPGTLVSGALKDLDAPGQSVNDGGIFSFLGSSEGLAVVLKYVAIVCAVLIVIGGIFWLVRRRREASADREETMRQTFKKIFDRQMQVGDELKLLKDQSSAELKHLANQVTRLDNAYRTLARQSPKAGSQADDYWAADRSVEQTRPATPKEEPEFPAAADTYLQRMKHLNRQSTVIRPDFQNGILVKDPEGRGELVLIQDPQVSESLQRLLVIPSVGQFQMKQDFYNYYDPYYDCDQPSAGDVWILNPAVVEKVSGGWRLTAKGRLEVR